MGGKTFPLERLLGIFEAILGERHDYASQCIDVLMQVRPSLPRSSAFTNHVRRSRRSSTFAFCSECRAKDPTRSWMASSSSAS